MVLGHLLEVASAFPHKQVIYTVIYSFHMPAFLFLSGMFARFDRVKWLFGLCLPYLALQTLYILFARQMYDPGLPLQFSQPYWLLWYLFALAVSSVMGTFLLNRFVTIDLLPTWLDRKSYFLFSITSFCLPEYLVIFLPIVMLSLFLKSITVSNNHSPFQFPTLV